MVAAARISESRGLLTAQEADRVQRVIAGFGLPVSMPFDPGAAMDAIRRDKKRDSDRVNFVLLRGLGQAEVVPIPLDELAASLNSNF
jgi:3-dehydroquinate synthase